MSTSAPLFTTVGIVGTGAMGRGIAQIAAQAGSTVVLFDTQAAAVEKAREALGAQWNKLVEKGRLTPEQATAQKERLQPAATLADLAPANRIELLIGAEGGLDPQEMLAAEQAGFQAVRLGPRVLRTETAGLAAVSALQTLWGDFGRGEHV